jgi:hypothetical protein
MKKLELAEKTARDFISRMQEETRSWEAEGKDAWTALKRLRGENLPSGDEVIIARRLHREVHALKARLRDAGLGIGKFATDAGLGNEGDYSKELYRITLSPEKDPDKVRLRKSAAKYRDLIAAISRYTKESVSSLANRLLMGTSLHPADAKDWDEVEQVQVALQAMVDIVDREYGLYMTYMETAEEKAEHAKSMGELRWPHYDADVTEFDLAGKEVPEWEADMNRLDFLDACNPQHAFWMHTTKLRRSPDFWWPISHDSGCLQDDGFFYVPHVHLGYIDIFNIPHPDAVGKEANQKLSLLIEGIRDELRQEGEIPRDDWDEENLAPVGQTTSLGVSTHYHAWIIIYPTPDNLRLMPMLYVAHEEGGPYILPLDAGNLNLMRKAYWVSSSEVTSVFERIKQLLGYVPRSQKVILEGLRRTAPWLKHNPILKLKNESEADRQMLKDFCNSLLQAGQPEEDK